MSATKKITIKQMQDIAAETPHRSVLRLDAHTGIGRKKQHSAAWVFVTAEQAAKIMREHQNACGWHLSWKVKWNEF